MLARGLTISPKSGDEYFWEVNLHGVKFKLKLCKFDYSFINVPKVYLLKNNLRDEQSITHINADGSLCYLDINGVYLDPYEPEESLSLILNAIEDTLARIIDNSSMENDFQNEFSAYWNGELATYLLDEKNLNLCNLYEYSDAITKEKQFEAVFFDSNNQERLLNWFEKRKKIKLISEFPIVSIRLNSPLIPDCRSTNSSWPPQSWTDFFDWFSKTQSSSVHALIEKLNKALSKSLSQFILFTFHDETKGEKHFFAIQVKFHQSILPMLNRYIGKSKKRKISFRDLRTSISKSKTAEFKRVIVIDASVEHILQRNFTGKLPLANKRITVIGAGTIGAQLVDMLVKSGVASNNLGKLTLADNDYLKPGNLTRHLLDETYLGCNKVEALKTHLESKYTWKLNITVIKKHLESEDEILNILNSNDLVIDATGMPQFSTLLAHTFRSQKKYNENLPASILHCWVDANGLAARTLLDDNCFACYRCLQINNHSQLIERFPLATSKKSWPEYASINTTCGNSFTPYGEGVSSVVAGIAHSQTIDYFHEKSYVRFQHKSFHPSVPPSKSQNVPALKKCACCNA